MGEGVICMCAVVRTRKKYAGQCDLADSNGEYVCVTSRAV